MAYEIGVVGLGVMGSNLALNMIRNGVQVVGYDLDIAKTRVYIEKSRSLNGLKAFTSPESFVSALQKPCRILLMVPAGEAVDSAIAQLKPYLEKGDLLVDGGNSFFMDTERRGKALESEGFYLIGAGVSGGEEGALWGPAIMPGGQPEAWEFVRPVFEKMAAKVDGEPCVAYIGPRSAGHYVKMVHNGIEYADMQLIAEIYDLLHRGIGFSNAELADVFSQWNQKELRSYLIEITSKILSRLDDETGEPLVDIILDEAAQKGTGKWASQNALDLGAPIPTINAAVESRLLSSLKAERITASRSLGGKLFPFSCDHLCLIDLAEQALYASKITAYAQGFGMLKLASQEYGYGLDLARIARIWRAGCIIRADMLNEIMTTYEHDPDLPNLLLADGFKQAIAERTTSWRRMVQLGVGLGIPMLATSASLAYFDAYRSERLPANLIQAQRDYFGAHAYRRIDKPGVFHTEWQ